MELQDQIDTGRQAEEFLRYTSEHPYFNGLIDRMKLELVRHILEMDVRAYKLSGLDAAKEMFIAKRMQMHILDDVLDAVRGDIYLASEALKQIDGVIDRGGIL
jgi:hypothetical protein